MKKIVFLGDSITDAFHKMNVDKAGLGNGYVALIGKKLRDRGRDDFLRNSGHDGFTVSGLLRLFEYDCLQFHPDLVSVQIGCNDAAVYRNTGKTLKEQEFAQNYRKLLGRIQEETTARILCMGPFIFPHPLEYANWIPTIREVEAIQREIAGECGAVFLPLHDRLNQAAEESGYDAITTDGTHLTQAGAGVVAEAWLAAEEGMYRVEQKDLMQARDF